MPHDPTDTYMMEVLNGGEQLQSFELDHISAAINRDKSISAPMRNILTAKLGAMQTIRREGTPQNGSTTIAIGNGQYSGGNMAVATGQVAEFSIIITRNSSKIRSALPVVLFMTDFLSNKYQMVINNFLQQLSPGTVLADVTNVNGNTIRFTFTNGANTDQIDITCDTTAYPSMLNSLFTTWFKTLMLRMELNNLTTPSSTDSDAGRQFKQSIAPIYDTNFGAFGGQRCPLTNCKPPNQFLKNVIDVPWAKFALSPREGWMFPVVAAGTSDADKLEIAIAHPVQEFTRSSAGR